MCQIKEKKVFCLLIIRCWIRYERHEDWSCWCWKQGSWCPDEQWICGQWDFPDLFACKNIRYCCSSHGRGSVHETPLFPPPSAVCLCLVSAALSFIWGQVIQWSNVREVFMHLRLPVCTYTYMWMYFYVCFRGLGVFYFCFCWCRIKCGSHMWVETVWGLVVSCTPTLDFLLLLFVLLYSLFHSLSPLSRLRFVCSI